MFTSLKNVSESTFIEMPIFPLLNVEMYISTGSSTILEPRDQEIHESYDVKKNVVQRILMLQNCERVGRVRMHN